MKKVVIIGAGPAGLTAAYELLKNKDNGETYQVTVLEESDCFGGISKTVNYKGNRMDMGGHRFFSKMPEVNDWWHAMMPMQGAPAKDDVLLSREVPLAPEGPDPEKEDVVMLTRHRVSRIFFDDKFYDYPISLKPETFLNMGFCNTVVCGCSYLKSMVRKLPEDNLENFYINRFGKKLYGMFFEYYTENLWGRHPREIDASWGNQRVKGLSIAAVLKDVFGKMGAKLTGKKDRKVETSLIEQFQYPKLGPGQLWDVTAEKVTALGGEIKRGAHATGVMRDASGKIVSVTYEHCAEVEQGKVAAVDVAAWSSVRDMRDEKASSEMATDAGDAGAVSAAEMTRAEATSASADANVNTSPQPAMTSHTIDADIVISSMPVKDLVAGMNDVPDDIAAIAAGLPYRDYMTLGVLVPRLKIQNKTKLKTVGNIVPDCWVYVQDRRVKMGRFQIYNNWSPYMVKDLENTVWIGLEYFVDEGDDTWRMDGEAFAALGVEEMVKIGLIDSADDVLDTHMEKVKKAYPAYFDTYDEMDKVVAFLSSIDNLYCVGRNGQHRYNNLDHSMCTSFEAVKNIVTGAVDKSNIWSVNTEQEYHEAKTE